MIRHLLRIVWNRRRANALVALEMAKQIFGGAIAFAQTNYAALPNADALVIVTEWNEYRNPDFDRMKAAMRAPVIFDGRNIYNPQEIQALGFAYVSIGRLPGAAMAEHRP